MTSLNELTPPPAEEEGSALRYCFVPAEEERPQGCASCHPVASHLLSCLPSSTSCSSRAMFSSEEEYRHEATEQWLTLLRKSTVVRLHHTGSHY